MAGSYCIGQRGPRGCCIYRLCASAQSLLVTLFIKCECSPESPWTKLHIPLGQGPLNLPFEPCPFCGFFHEVLLDISCHSPFTSTSWDRLPCTLRPKSWSTVGSSSQFPEQERTMDPGLHPAYQHGLWDGQLGWGLPQTPTLYSNKHDELLANQGSVGLRMTWHHKQLCDPAPGRAAFCIVLSSWLIFWWSAV